MNIQTLFSQALFSQPKLSSRRDVTEFLGQFIAPTSSEQFTLLHILSGGTITATFPWSFELRNLDCFLLLYTKQGSGKLQTDACSYKLTPMSLLLLNGNQHFKLEISTEPWEYQIYFFTGSAISHYTQLLAPDNLVLTPLSFYSDLMMSLERLPSTLPGLSVPSLAQKLQISDLLNHMIILCLTASLENNRSRQAPSYIHKMKALFDHDYQEPYTLEQLERDLGVSKYKLCREFRVAYDISPLQYLNRRRIEAAANLLISSNQRVHEIGSQVGIENTNHFINLFKKFLNCTPTEYKQRMTL